MACDGGAAQRATGMEVHKNEAQVLKYYLTSQQSYKVGQSVRIGFRIENVSRDRLWFLIWYTPFEGIRGKIFQVTRDGKSLQYQGRMVKRGEPRAEDYMRIDPGESLSVDVDLSAAYDFSIPGTYQVRFKGRIYDVVKDAAALPRKRDQHQIINITGNSVTFNVAQ
jgi:peptidyl-Lys metalloendopeptidase